MSSTSDARYDAHNRLTRIVGQYDLPGADTHEGSVTAFLGDHADELQLPAGGEMRVVHRADTETGSVVRLQQYVGGVPVHGSEIVVASDTDSRVRQVDVANAEHSIATAPPPAADGGEKKLTAKQAAKKGLEALGAGVSVRGTAPDPTSVYFPSDEGLRLAYAVLIPTTDPPHDWRLIVDARTGDVLERTDLIMHIDGKGLVFDPNPVVSAQNAALRDPDATAASCGFAGTARATIDGQRASRDLLAITKGADGKHRLEGPYVKMGEFGAPATTFPAETDPTAFNYSSGDPRFECVQAYWTIDTLQRYLQSIGITTAHNSQIAVDPHDTEDGPAWFSPIDQALHFSASGACRPDRAEDAECIMHEYGHAIQNNQVPTWGGSNPTTGRAETGAMGEGFGDALACIFTASKSGGFGREVFEDWVFGDTGGLRRVDGTKVYPGDWHSEVHDDGEIWSAALWNVYRAIGGDSVSATEQEAARRAVLKSVILSHHLLAGNASMPDGAEAVMNQNAALPEYRGKHLKQMLDSFHTRGLLPCSPATDLYIHDVATDLGAESTAGQAFWDSPDLWIRHADDNGTTHEPPEFGQDNWFYARVTNRGTATARAFVVTFNVKLWGGTEFVYPGDWDPFISAACGFNLAPGASRVVKARWPREFVPAKGAHACWLASVYTPVESAPGGRHTWESNNLAQKNLTIVDVLPNSSFMVPFQIGNLGRLVAEHVRLEIRRPLKFQTLAVSVVSSQPGVVERLFTSVLQTPIQPEITAQPAGSPVLRFPHASEIEIVAPAGVGAAAAPVPVRMMLGAQSSVALGAAVQPRPPGGGGNGGSAPGTRDADLLSAHNGDAGGAIVFRPGITSGIPVGLNAREAVSVAVKIQAPREAGPGETFDVDVVERSAKGEVIGGIRIRANVVDKQ